MKKPIVTVRRDTKMVYILINNITHVGFDYEKFVMFQAWINGENSYAIKLTFDTGASDRLEYENRQLWRDVITAITEIL